jgi:hypothetical protein
MADAVVVFNNFFAISAEMHKTLSQMVRKAAFDVEAQAKLDFALGALSGGIE